MVTREAQCEIEIRSNLGRRKTIIAYPRLQSGKFERCRENIRMNTRLMNKHIVILINDIGIYKILLNPLLTV